MFPQVCDDCGFVKNHPARKPAVTGLAAGQDNETSPGHRDRGKGWKQGLPWGYQARARYGGLPPHLGRPSDAGPEALVTRHIFGRAGLP